MPTTVELSLIVYNILGQPVKVLFEGLQVPGYHQVTWDSRDDAGQPVSNGVYFYRLVGGLPAGNGAKRPFNLSPQPIMTAVDFIIALF